MSKKNKKMIYKAGKVSSVRPSLPPSLPPFFLLTYHAPNERDPGDGLHELDADLEEIVRLSRAFHAQKLPTKGKEEGTEGRREGGIRRMRTLFQRGKIWAPLLVVQGIGYLYLTPAPPPQPPPTLPFPPSLPPCPLLSPYRAVSLPTSLLSFFPFPFMPSEVSKG